MQCPARYLEPEVISNEMLEGLVLDLVLENNDS